MLIFHRYIDVIGRGAHLRTSVNESLRYGYKPRCYYNPQRYGSPLYQRFKEYYGPQYDIQTGHSHPGYGNVTSYKVWCNELDVFFLIGLP